MRQELRPAELIDILKSKIAGFSHETKEIETGQVIQANDGIARAWGLDRIMFGELVEIDTEAGTVVTGMVMNLEEDTVGIILFADAHRVKEGDLVRRTGAVARVPAGEALLGRVVDALGRPIDGLGPLEHTEYRPVEVKGPGILERFNVCEPMQTGIKAIDAMIPIGRGQRELIIGDRRTGKTTIAIDAIINQKHAAPDQRVRCFYVAIGQKRSTVVQLAETLRRHGVLEYTTIIAATASDPASMQYLAPYAGTAMAEYFRDSGRHALIVYDDLTKHSQAYREISLLMRRSPGREAFPGDIFYLHSRLLERSARMSAALGGGSLTSLPIVETQDGDVSAYIPTNVISITDGQIFLETNLFNSGLRPAINVGISVSRVGGDAQIMAMKKVAGSLRMDLAQFRELAAFMQFSSDLDPATKRQLDRGERLTEILKQRQYAPIDVAKQVLILRAGISGRLDKYPTAVLLRYQDALFDWLDSHSVDFLSELRGGAAFTEEATKRADALFDQFEQGFRPESMATDIDAGYTLNLAMAIGQKAGSGLNRDILNMIERITEKELSSPTLENELENIITGKDSLENDRLDQILEDCPILDLPRKSRFEELVQQVAKTMALKDPTLKVRDLKAKYLAREKANSTALTPFFALPHIVLEDHGHFQLILVRSKEGVFFSEKHPEVHAMFFLAGTMDHRHLHLVVISALAQIVKDPSFAEVWLNASSTEPLRDLVKTLHAKTRK